MISNDESGGQFQRTRDGTQGISEYLFSLLPSASVKLASPVQSISQSSSSAETEPVVKVTTRAGVAYSAKHVICTIPSPICAFLTWSPPLPSPQQALVQRSFMGVQGKCIVVYPKPWWREAGWSGTHQSSEGPMTEIFDTCDGDIPTTHNADPTLTGATSPVVARQYSLTGFITGRRAIDFFSPDKTDDQRQQEALDQISRLFNDHSDARRPSQIIYHDWTRQEFTQGAPCPNWPTGAMGTYGQYYGERHGQVWYAGSEHSKVWQGYMEGAVHSGRKTADEVLRMLS